MEKRRTKPLIPPLSGRWARMGFCLLFSATAAVSMTAQVGEGTAAQPPRNLNSELRTRTWSVYAQGGLSWAGGLWYQDLDASRSYKLAPAVGGGVDFTVRPWVRIGAEYLWSRYRREQRFAAPDTKTVPVKVYGNYLMNCHNAKLALGFNAMELWPARRAQWLNVWLGTGVGYTFAKGNEYAVHISNTLTKDGKTAPLLDGTTVGNESQVTVTGNLRTTNRHEKFNTLYIPASLHIEADVSRRFTLGIKGEADWLMNRKDIAPKNLVFALATVRYNFVPSRAAVQRACYEGEIARLNGRMNDLQRQAQEEKARAGREAQARRTAEEQNAGLQRRLADCENSRPAAAPAVQAEHFVQFAHNSARISREEAAHLKAFARSVRGQKLTLVAEASTPGTDGYNQRLSEQRLERVAQALVREGCDRADLRPMIAIGERNGKPAAEGRRVTIKTGE